MIVSPCSIAWILVCVFWSGVAAAPTSVSIPETASDSATTSTATSDPNFTSSPSPYGFNTDGNSSPVTTIVIICAVGGLCLLAAGWIFFKRTRPQSQLPVIVVGPNTSPTMVFAPNGSGDMPPVTAIPSLRYNAPPMSEPVVPCADVITPPPPAYDVATGVRPGLRDSTSSSVLMAGRPGKERSDSRWKDLLLSPGRE